MDYSEKLIKKIFQSASWQCTNCKTCHVCQEANDDVRLVQWFKLKKIKISVLVFPNNNANKTYFVCLIYYYSMGKIVPEGNVNKSETYLWTHKWVEGLV